ncbi:transposase [Streptomyces nitrosporeus]
MAEPRRPVGGGGAGGEGPGRSHGGFTSKIHLSADGRCRPLSLIVTPGQRADCTQFIPVLEKIRVLRLGFGRPRKKPDSIAADKGIQQRPLPPVSATARHPAHDPGKCRQSGRPPAQRIARWPAARVQRGAAQEAQHSREGHQQAARHRHRSRPRHLAPHLTACQDLNSPRNPTPTPSPLPQGSPQGR